ncbi:hypothetical protein [Amycolatopsis sp. NPDC049159]|uniref:hypothetical protein n=1 Tax=Amycolatopsis sp. NPDC049159 TaxID=3157210 RepID=UPI0033F355C8
MKFSAALRPPRELRRTRAVRRTISAWILISLAVMVSIRRPFQAASAFFQQEP